MLYGSLEERRQTIAELGFRAEGFPALEGYLRSLCQANEDLNLVSRKMTFEELIDNHVIDCLLAIAKFPPEAKSVADLGSGGGLPGVLFAIQFPEVRFLLFEKSPLKREFLSRCREFAPNLEVHGEIPRDFPIVDLVTARAFKPIDVILELSRKHFERGGRYFLLKGRAEKIDEELALARKKFKSLPSKTTAIVPLASPVLEVERHLVLI